MYLHFLRLAAIVTMLGVIFGAFGTHGLQNSLAPRSMKIFETAVNYQMWHGIGLGIIASFSYHFADSRTLFWAGWSMFIGILLFSGSLYALTLTDMKWFGPITPIGGMALILSWFLLFLFSLREAKRYSSEYGES